MFFKKRRDAKKAAVEDARQDILKDLRNRFDAAQNCTDPAERFLKLEEIRETVDAVTGVLKGEIVRSATDNGELAFLSTLTAGTSGAAWLVVGVHFPPLLALAGIAFGAAASVRAGKKMALHSHQKQLAQNKPFIDALEVEKARAVEAEDSLLASRQDDMAASPQFEDLLNRVPRVREHFSRAYGRKIAEEKAFDKPSPPKPPSGDSHFHL